jgi:hypothetical protein
MSAYHIQHTDLIIPSSSPINNEQLKSINFKVKDHLHVITRANQKTSFLIVALLKIDISCAYLHIQIQFHVI